MKTYNVQFTLDEGDAYSQAHLVAVSIISSLVEDVINLDGDVDQEALSPFEHIFGGDDSRGWQSIEDDEIRRHWSSVHLLTIEGLEGRQIEHFLAEDAEQNDGDGQLAARELGAAISELRAALLERGMLTRDEIKLMLAPYNNQIAAQSDHAMIGKQFGQMVEVVSHEIDVMSDAPETEQMIADALSRQMTLFEWGTFNQFRRLDYARISRLCKRYVGYMTGDGRLRRAAKARDNISTWHSYQRNGERLQKVISKH